MQTIGHKLHPALSMLSEIATNKDYYGNRLWNPDDNLPTEAKQFLTYMGKSFLPYSVQGLSKNMSADGSVGMAVAPFVGITPAPGDVTHSKFQNFVKERYAETPEGQRYKNQTPEQQDESARFFDTLNAARRGENPDMSDLSVRDRRTIQHMNGPNYNTFGNHFGKLDIVAQLRAYDMATPQEQEQYKLRPILLKGSVAKIRALPVDERQDALKRVYAIRQQGYTQ